VTSQPQPFQFQLAPSQLMQAINPWTWNVETPQIGLVNISLGATSHPEVERAVLDEVGSDVMWWTTSAPA